MEKEEIDFDLIRECLVKHADRIGRPHYDVVVVRRVLNAFAKGLDDPLKVAVGKIICDDHSCNVHNRRKELIADFCNRTGALNILADLIGMQRGELRKIAQGELVVTDTQWAKLLDCFDKAEAIYREKRDKELIYLDKKLATHRRFE